MKTPPLTFRRLCLALVMTLSAPWASGQLVQTLKDINETPVGPSTEPDSMALAGGNLFIATDNALTGSELWRYTVLASFNGARGVAADTAGNLYVADTANHVIRKISTSGMVSILAGNLGVTGQLDGAGMAAKFNSPSGITVLNEGPLAGLIFVADTGNHTIRRITPEGVVTTVAGNVQSGVGQAGYIDNISNAQDARFRSPRGVAARQLGTGTSTNIELYVADSGNHAIRRVQLTPTSNPVTSFAGATTSGAFPGAGTAGFQDGTGTGTGTGPGTGARFNDPGALALNSFTTDRSLYVADTGNNRIRRVSLGGVVTTVAGSATAGAADGTGTGASFNAPQGIICDAATTAASLNVYVADTGNHLIRRVVPNTGTLNSGVVTTLAGSGAPGAANGSGASASFSSPRGLAFRGTEVFVADTGNHVLRSVVTGTGAVSLRAGQFGLAGSLDGSAIGTATPVPLQLADIFPGPGNSHPENLTAVGTDVFFSARNGAGDRDLWKSDGTPAGTLRVGNTSFPNDPDGPKLLTAVGNRLYFQGYDIGTGAELWQWRSAANPNTSPKGITEAVEDIFPDEDSSLMSNLYNANGTLLFGAASSQGNVELWKSTFAAGESTTSLVAELFTGTVGSNPSDFISFNGTVYFVATSDMVVASQPVGRELFKLDLGTLTADPTLSNMLVQDLDTVGDSEPRNLVVSGPSGATAAADGGQLFFTASEPDRGRELYVMNSDNGMVPTRVIDLNGTAEDSDIDNITPITFTIGAQPRPNRVIFTGDSGNGLGVELQISDGTALGTVLLKDLSPGENSSTLDNFIQTSAGVVIFTKLEADDTVTLWRTDGTDTGTVQIEDFTGEGGMGDSVTAKDFRAPVRIGTNVYFMMASDELWRTNGQNDAGTVLIHRFRTSTESSNSQGFTRLDQNRVVFSATTPANGNEPWVTNLQTHTTNLISDVLAGTLSSEPAEYTATGDGRIFFSAEALAGERQLFLTDGVAVTSMPEIEGAGSADPANFFWNASQNKLYFSAKDGGTNTELWVLSSPLGGPNTLAEIEVNSSENGSFPDNFIAYKDFVYFSAETGAGMELWRTNGVDVGGTTPFMDIATGVQSSSPAEFVVMPPTGISSKLYFIATGSGIGTSPQETGRELWVTDGTTAGTKVVKDIIPGGVSSISDSQPAYLTMVGPKTGNTYLLFYVADDGQKGRELWKSDGTAAGTVMVKDINAVSIGTNLTEGSNPTELRNVNGTLFFLADNGIDGRELWMSDGTAAGTKMVKFGGHDGLVAGAADAGIQDMTVIKDVLCFTADAGVSGREVWITDGTELGTNILTEFVSGPGSSYPHHLAAMDSQLFFSASDVDIGDEPRVATLSSRLVVSRQVTKDPLVVEELVNNVSVVDFTPTTAVVFGDKEDVTIRLSNLGTTGITNVAYSISGLHAADFKITNTKKPDAVPRSQTESITIQFKPSEGGERTASLQITSSDSPLPFVVALSGDCTKDPTVVTHPVSRIVKVGAPVTMSSTATTTSLTPATVQWLRNGAPVAGATLNPLYLWSAKLADGGAYTAKFTSASKGTGLSNVAQLAVVEDFMPARVFTLKEGTKGKPITVNATGNGLTYQWKYSLNSDLSSPQALPAVVVPASATTKTLAFSTSVNVTVANTGYYFCEITSAAGTVIGGTTHVKVFNAAPELVVGQTLPVGIVGSAYFYQVQVNPDVLKSVTKFEAAPLPGGLKIDSVTGIISGVPTGITFSAPKVPGAMNITLKVSNGFGGFITTQASIRVIDFPAGLEGSFQGLVERNEEINESTGGRIELTVAAKGAFSGKVTFGVTPYPFKGNLTFTESGGSVVAPYTGTTRILRKGISAPLDLTFTIDETTRNHLSAGSLTSVNSSGPVNAEVYAWKVATAPPAANPQLPRYYSNVKGATNTYNFGIRLPAQVNSVANPNVGNLAVPQGTGYGSFVVSNKGMLSIAGMTADGEKITCGTFVGPNGEVLIYQSLYTTVKKGSICGLLVIGTGADQNAVTDNVINANPVFPFDWTRPPATAVIAATANTRSYRAGFGLVGTPVETPVELEAFGGYYDPNPGKHLLQITDNEASTTADNASLTFTGGGVESARLDPDATHVSVNLSTAKVPTTPPPGHPASTKFAATNLKSGLFSGSFKLLDDDTTTAAVKDTELTRTVNFLGLIVPEAGNYRGVGYFMLPQLPPNLDVELKFQKLTPFLSGRVDFDDD